MLGFDYDWNEKRSLFIDQILKHVFNFKYVQQWSGKINCRFANLIMIGALIYG